MKLLVDQNSNICSTVYHKRNYHNYRIKQSSPLGHKANINTSGKATKKQHENHNNNGESNINNENNFTNENISQESERQLLFIKLPYKWQ